MKERGIVIIAGSMGSGKNTCMQKLVFETNINKDWKVKDASYMITENENDQSKVIIVWEYNTNPSCWIVRIVHKVTPEMRIWSILLIKSDLKWCIHLSRSLFL